MAIFSSLPVELQHQCVQDFDVKTLKQFRLTSRAAAEIGAEHLFHTVVLTFHESSVEKLHHILEKEALTQKVKEILVDGMEGDGEKEYETYRHKWEEDDPVYTNTAWYRAIRDFARFPNLRHVELWLNEEYNDEEYCGGQPQNTEYREVYQNRFFEALKDTDYVESLALKNMQDFGVENTGSKQAFEAVRGRLKRFAIMIATNDCGAAPENKVDQEELHNCFNFQLHVHWLEPLQPQLTHLTLYCDTYWGVYPFMDVRDLYFPNLISLALGNWSIAHDWQFDWIMSHGNTLEELILDDVAIVYAMWMPEAMAEWNWPEMDRGSSSSDEGVVIGKQYGTRWNDVLPRFQQQLTKLKRFAMGHGDWHENMFDYRYDLPAQIQHQRYITYYNGIGPSQWTELFDESYQDKDGVEVQVKELDAYQDEKDEEALNELLRAIGTTEVEIERMKGLVWGYRSKCWIDK